ncbi:MAG: hypothetical protein J3Q66DRAFT_37042 [Benniella sp.]|nr:MAG: hypothetical protein J3Q66DRAFT_37042 [Benniella sp.]
MMGLPSLTCDLSNDEFYLQAALQQKERDEESGVELASLSLSLVLLANGSSARLVVGVANGLIDANILLLTEVGVKVVLGKVLLHLGETLGSRHLAQPVVLELVCLFKLLLILVAFFSLRLAFMFPVKGDKNHVNGCRCELIGVVPCIPFRANSAEKLDAVVRAVDLLADDGHRVVWGGYTHASYLGGGSAVGLGFDVRVHSGRVCV